jgi:perosamine synthetase
MNTPVIPLFKPYIAPRDELIPAIEKVLYSGQIGQGPAVEQLEKEFSEYIGAPYCVAVSSCTAALHIALILIGSPERIFTTPMTAEPTNMAILHERIVPVFLDSHAVTGNILCDPRRSARHFVINTAVAVDYGGIPVDLESFRHMLVIEDAAHALGAKRHGRMVGQDAFATCFSFQAIKHVTTGDGGMLVCKNKGDAERARRLRWFGIDRNASRENVAVKEVGYKYNMNDLTATIGLVQLRHANEIVEAHRANAKFFDQELRGVQVVLHQEPDDEPSYWFLTILSDRLTMQRPNIMQHMENLGISCGRVHRRNDEHPIFSKYQEYLPGLDSFYDRMLHIPCGWWLTDQDRERIVTAINAWGTL